MPKPRIELGGQVVSQTLQFPPTQYLPTHLLAPGSLGSICRQVEYVVPNGDWE